MKRALLGAVATAGAALALVGAVGANPTLPGNTPISAAITSPANGTLVGEGKTIPVGGTATIGAATSTPDTTMVYIVDLSGSTTASPPNPTTSSCTQANVYDTFANTTLDCELLAVSAMNRAVSKPGSPVLQTALIGFGGADTGPIVGNGLRVGTAADAYSVDLVAPPGTPGYLIAPNAHAFVPGAGMGPTLRFLPQNDLDWVLQSAFTYNARFTVNGWPDPTSLEFAGEDGFMLFQPAYSDANTNYWAAVNALHSLLHSVHTPKTQVVFLSDGDSNVTGPQGTQSLAKDALTAIKNDLSLDTSVSIDSFAIGNSASCSPGGVIGVNNAGTLQQIADAFPGGTCTHIVDPANALTAVPAIVSAALQKVQFTLDNQPSGSFTYSPAIIGPDRASFSTTLPAQAPGDHTVCAIASGTDSGGQGDSDPSCATFTVVTRPTLTLNGAGSGTPVAEINEGGGTYHLAPTATTDPHTSPTYEWTSSGGDGHCSFTHADQLVTDVTCDNQGVYTLTLKLDDGANDPVTQSVLLQVDNVPAVPTLTLSAGTVPLSNPHVDATVSIVDPGRDGWHCLFTWGDLQSDTTASPDAVTRSCAASHDYAAAGQYTVTVTAMDDKGEGTQDHAVVVVKSPPSFDGLPSDGLDNLVGTVDEGSPFAIGGSTTGASSVTWSEASGHCTFTAQAVPTSVTCNDGPGTYALVVTASDTFGQTATRTLHLQVNNVAPTFSMSLAQGGADSRTVTFTGSVYDPGTIDSPTCTVDWGDGTVDTALAVTGGFCHDQHTYGSTAQSATVTAFAIDKDGAKSPTSSQTLTFNRPPVCSAVHPNVVTLWPADHRLVLVTLSGATDPDTGDTLTYGISSVKQDEPLLGLGSGDTSPDAKPASGASVWLRAERDGTGDGRVYTITYTVTDSSGASCTGGAHTVTVSVPHDTAHAAVKSGTSYNSFG